MFRVSLVQSRPAFLRLEQNLSALGRLMKGLRSDLVVLPELAASGYRFRSKAEAHRAAESAADGPTARFLRAEARRLDAAIVAGFAEKAGGRLYNAAMFVTPTASAVYRKTHLFGEEKRWFSPGDTGFQVFSWKRVRIGVMICFDWMFPESARTLALLGADIIAHPSNLVMPHCPDSMPVRSRENRVFAATANRVGTENGLRFIGSSQLTAPDGRILRRLSRTDTGVATVPIRPADARVKRLAWGNDLFRERRPEFYL